jgi:hypothetical protein
MVPSSALLQTRATQYYDNSEKKMNLNVSLDDLRLGRYEGAKELIVNRLVKRRAILNDPEKEVLPATFVRNELLALMVGECGKKGVVVVRAPRGFGKTTAAKFILKNSSGDHVLQLSERKYTTLLERHGFGALLAFHCV